MVAWVVVAMLVEREAVATALTNRDGRSVLLNAESVMLRQ